MENSSNHLTVFSFLIRQVVEQFRVATNVENVEMSWNYKRGLGKFMGNSRSQRKCVTACDVLQTQDKT